MAFWRVRGQAISLLHGRRTGGGVKQKILHTFASFSELSKALKPENWARFTQSVEQAHPQVAPKWDQVQQQGCKLVQEAIPSQEPQLEDWNKIRKALRFVARALYQSPVRPVDHQKTVALAPELLDCLEAGLTRLHGHEQTALQTLVPNMEKTDALVEQARNAFYRSPTSGNRFFQAARDYNPYSPDVLNSWGVCYFENNQLDKALERFQQAREMAKLQLPDVDKVYSWGNLRVRPYLRATANLALLKARQGHYQEALDLYLHCLERCPDDGMGARFHLGGLYERLGRLDEALRAFREERGTGFVEMPDSHYDGARVLVKLNRAEEAVGWLLKGVSINPFILAALKTTGRCQPISHAPVDSLDWALNYAAATKPLWSGAPKKWLNGICKDGELMSLVGTYKELLLDQSSWREREVQAELILAQEARLKQ